MPRLLAIEWDPREFRLALANQQRGKLTIEALERVEIPAADGEPDPAELGARLGEAVRRIGAGRARVLIGLGRPQIELRQLTLDEVADDDLPGAVRAAWQSETNAGADAIVDFVPRQPTDDGRRQVGAACLSAGMLATLNEICRAAGVKPARVLASPYAGTSWYLAWGRPAGRTCLLVDRAGEEADLWVVARRDLIFTRTARLPAPAEGEDGGSPLVGEIKRTLVAVANQPGGQPVEIEAIVVCGSAGHDRELLQRIAAELKHPVEIFDPLTGPELAPSAKDALPESRGHWTSTLGLLLAESDEHSGQIDFLHPRRPPRRLDRRQASLVGMVGGLVLLAAGLLAYAWTTLGRLDDQLARLKAQSTELDSAVKRANEKQEAVATISQWADGEVNWLDELRDLSARFPKRRDGVLQRITLGRNPSGGGMIELAGLVRDPTIVGRMENTLRDAHHEVRSKRVQESRQGHSYTWQFESSVSITPRTREEYLASLPAEVLAPVARQGESEPLRPVATPPAEPPLPQPPGARP